MNYKFIQWRTNSNGVITEISVEYEPTFIQQLLRKHGISRTWISLHPGGSWWVKIGQDVARAIEEKDKKEIKMLASALHSIEVRKALDAMRGW